MRNLLYLINPISGTRNKASFRQLVEQKTREAGTPFAIYPSVANGDYRFLGPIIKDEGFTDIIIAGGDGTVNQAVQSLRRWKLPLAYYLVVRAMGWPSAPALPKSLKRPWKKRS